MVSLCRSASKKYVIRFTNVRCRCDCFHVTSQRGLSFGKALYLIAFIFKTSVSVYFWFLLTLYSAEAIIVPHHMIWSWYTGRWWVGCYIWYSEKGTGWSYSPPRPFLTEPNITAHPSTASVPIMNTKDTITEALVRQRAKPSKIKALCSWPTCKNCSYYCAPL